MATLEEVIEDLGDLSKSEYLLDDIQYIIDENLRTIAIPDDGVVLGVVGDKNVNRVNFQMPRYYNGFDMSLFKYRINYRNANGDLNFYDVGDATIKDDLIYFTWLVDHTAAAYIGKVSFVVRLYKTEGTNVTQNFYTTYNTANVLEGLFVDEELEEIEDVTLHIQRILEEYAYEIAEPILNSWLVDHSLTPGATKEQVKQINDIQNQLNALLTDHGDYSEYEMMKEVFHFYSADSTELDLTTIRGTLYYLNVFTNSSSSDGSYDSFTSGYVRVMDGATIKINKDGVYYIDMLLPAYLYDGTESNDTVGSVFIEVDNETKTKSVNDIYGTSGTVSNNRLVFLLKLQKDQLVRFKMNWHATSSDFNIQSYGISMYALDWDDKVKIPTIENEIIAARVGTDGTIYTDLGNAIRTQMDGKVDKNGLGQIIAQNTEFFEYKNILNNSNISIGKLNIDDGSITLDSDFITSDYIPCEESSKYVCSNSSGSVKVPYTCYYDSDKNYIGTNDDSELLITPENCAYLRVSVPATSNTLSGWQIEKGTTPTEFESCDHPKTVVKIKEEFIPNVIDMINNLVASNTTIDYGRAKDSDIGTPSIAFGQWVQASAEGAHAEGMQTNATGVYSMTQGVGTNASGAFSHAEGQVATASAMSSHAEGQATTASGSFSHAEGAQTTTVGDSSHAEGVFTKTDGSGSHAEGYNTSTSSYYAHAEGTNTKANGKASHAEGSGSEANGPFSHAEGSQTKALHHSAHSEGYGTEATNQNAHAEGYYTHADGRNSHSSGEYTIAGYKNQTVMGQYNENKENSLLEIGNGFDANSRSNAFEVDADGYATAKAGFKVDNKNVVDICGDAFKLELIDDTDVSERVKGKYYIVRSKNGNYFGEFNNTRDYQKGDVVSVKHTSKSMDNDIIVGPLNAVSKYKNETTITCTSSSTLLENGYLPTEAIDLSVSSEWATQAPPADTEWIMIAFPNKFIRVEKFAISWDTFYAHTFKFQYSQDGITWFDTEQDENNQESYGLSGYFSNNLPDDTDTKGNQYVLKEGVWGKYFRILVDSSDMSTPDTGIRIKEFALFESANDYYEFTQDFYGTGVETIADMSSYVQNYTIPSYFDYEVANVSYRLEDYKRVDLSSDADKSFVVQNGMLCVKVVEESEVQ